MQVELKTAPPPGVLVNVIATETVPTRKVTPRIIVEAVRRNWPVVNNGWMSACVHAQSVQPLERFSINAQDLLLRVKPIFSLQDCEIVVQN